MITTFANFLQSLHDKEAVVLKDQELVHAPTIGDMYEGLSKEILEQALPAQLGLRIVDGFVVGVDGTLSNQIDAMLVMGDSGTQIPKTTRWKWPIKDVIAVFEIKKNLYAADLADGIEKMIGVSKQHKELLGSSDYKFPSLASSSQAYAGMAGVFPTQSELEDLSNPTGEIIRTMAFDQLAPIRVIIGYEGYANESGLRDGFVKYIEDRINKGRQEFGPALLPNLIMCRKSSLIKMTGHPYMVPVDSEGWWPLIGSERNAPYRPLIEMLWTRLNNQLNTCIQMDDTTEYEQIARFIDGRPELLDGKIGWRLKLQNLSKSDLQGITSDLHEWRPLEISTSEMSLIKVSLDEGGMDLHDQEFIDACIGFGIDVDQLAIKLTESHMFARRGASMIEPIGDEIDFLFTPDGKLWASNNSTLMRLWMTKNYQTNG